MAFLIFQLHTGLRLNSLLIKKLGKEFSEHVKQMRAVYAIVT